MTMTACAITPRTGRPAEIWRAKAGIQKVVDCVLAQLNTSMSKGRPPTFTHSVRVITPGRVEEIIPQQIPSGSGELYVVRFVANDDGTTEVTLFSTLEGLDKRVEHAMAPCKGNGSAVTEVSGQ
jgi:hypothetical protein